MTQQTINLGVDPNGVGGDTERAAFNKCNLNFNELYSTGAATTGSNTNGTWTRYADGTLLMVRNISVTREINANEIAVISFPTPATMVRPELAACIFHAIPTKSNDQYGVICAYGDSPDGVTAILRNGASAQTFSIRCTVISRWK